MALGGVPSSQQNSDVSNSGAKLQGAAAAFFTVKRASTHIPCLYLPYQTGSSKILIYFHGNAEDVGLSYEMLDHIRSSLKINILAVEYPGYGIYEEAGGCDAERIT